MTVTLLSTAAIGLTASVAAPAGDQTIQIDTETLKGAVSGNVLSFNGIPYAAPPISNRRQAPQPADMRTYDPAKLDLMMLTLDKGAVMNADSWKDRLDLVEQAADAQPANAVRDLGGTSWQLVQFQSGDDTTLIPDDKAKYTITFHADGTVNTRIDCNRGRGTWTSTEPNQLQFGPLALTRAMCPPGSLHDRIARDWGFVRSYILKDGHLFLSLMADGGIYEFEPIESPQPGSSAPSSR